MEREPELEAAEIEVNGVNIGAAKAEVVRLRWNGNVRTRNKHMHNLVNQPDLPRPRDVKNIGQLMFYIRNLKASLEGSGLFKSVEVSTQAFGNEQDLSFGDKTEILINVKEKSKIIGEVGTEVDADQMGRFQGKFEISHRNVFGCGETFNIKTNNDPLSQLHKINSTPLKLLMPDTYCATFTKPILSTKDVQHPISEIQLQVEDKTNQLNWLQARERGRSASATLGLTPYKNGNYSHALGFNLSWRHLAGNVGASVPMTIREQFGHTQKASVSYRGALQQFKFSDDNTIPVKGFKIGTELEMAGFKGTSNFNKALFTLQNYESLGRLTTCMNLRAGFIHGTPDIQDKLYLGGPMDIRGYEQNTAGPKTGGTRLVGAGAHLYYPISRQGINLHAFATGGATTNDNRVESFKKQFRYSIGVGFCMGIMQNANLQVNYVIKPKSKMEMGVGFDIL